MSTIGSLLAMFFPLYAVMYIANVAERQRQHEQPSQAATLFCYLLLGFGFAGALLVGLLLQGALLILPVDSLGALTANDADPALGGGAAFSFESLPILALGIWLPGAGGLILLLRPVRQRLAAWIPIDPDNPVHTVALTFIMLVLFNLMITLGIGLGNLAVLMETDAMEESQTTLIMVWGQQILMALLALIGVGWFVRRSFAASIARLGITALTWRQGLIGFGLGLLMVPVVLTSIYLASLVGLGVDPDVERLTEQMIGPLFESPLVGILTLGLAAALGEELLFRGALQPRFGLLLTAAIFALVHSNYGISISTIVVFVLGLLLGWVRIRYNTSTAMVFHAVYNMTLGVLTTLSVSFLDF
jgi:uncharacterized protein